MVEVLLPTLGHIQDMQILLDIADVNIPILLDLDVLDENNLLLIIQQDTYGIVLSQDSTIDI